MSSLQAWTLILWFTYQWTQQTILKTFVLIKKEPLSVLWILNKISEAPKLGPATYFQQKYQHNDIVEINA